MKVTTTTQKLTFEEYLTYDDGTDNRYELEDGELILMNPPILRHTLIIYFISNAFVAEINRLNLPWVALQNVGVRTATRRARIPDLCVVEREQIEQYLDLAGVIEFPPLLAVEIVSPESKKRDYRYKRSEYSVVEIPEYWIVDFLEAKITILFLLEGFYEEKEYKGNELIISQVFPELKLTVEQILQA